MQKDNTKKTIHIKEKNLPLHCPMDNMKSWNSHPRVFLEIEKMPNHEILCPYCSTKYILE